MLRGYPQASYLCLMCPVERGANPVNQVIDELLIKGEPADICLALTLAGYSDTNHRASSVIAEFEGTQGFVGAAQRAAKSAYEKNTWSRVWYQKMLEARDQKEFWQASVLLTKIVDARFDVWSQTLRYGDKIFVAFIPTVMLEIKHQIEKWQNKRDATLFGEKSPADLFLPNRGSHIGPALNVTGA